LTKVLEKGRKFNACYYIAEILEPLSQWRSIEAAGSEQNCYCMRTMSACILPNYQLNILMRIERTRRHIRDTPLISRRPTFISSGISKNVSQASHSKMQISFLQQQKVFERILKSDLASGLSQVDGPIKEMYRYQWGGD
jgi:hypothetical protein